MLVLIAFGRRGSPEVDTNMQTLASMYLLTGFEHGNQLHMFCKEEYWYEERHNLDWNVFLPCLDTFNLKRRSLIQTFLLMMDESMSGW